MSNIAVELKEVTKRFDDVVAVDDVSLRIHKNEFFSLLGPSGCGKTTTLRMIGGFEHPTAGQVYIDGHFVNNVPPHRRDTNLIFQQLALFPHLDVYDNVAFGLRMKRLARADIKAKVRRALDLVELPQMESRRIHQLSGGQQQRIAIARALVNEPSVLLLDEPLGALDLKLRLQMQVELKKLQHRVGTTFIYVTHDQGEALTMSDRLVVMRDGRIEQLGTCEEVYEKPQTRFVASFIGDSNLLDGQVTSVNQTSGVVDIKGLPVVVARNEALRANQPVAISLRPERIKVDRATDSCENVFKAIIEDVTYKGAFIEYELKLPSGDTIMAQVQAGTSKLLPSGVEINIGWTKESCVAVAHDGEGG